MSKDNFSVVAKIIKKMDAGSRGTLRLFIMFYGSKPFREIDQSSEISDQNPWSAFRLIIRWENLDL
jgi:hypothetical protein